MNLSVKSILRKARLLAVLSLLAGGMQTVRAADVNCRPSTVYPAQNIIPNISISGSYAGNDLPLGSTIYLIGTNGSGAAIGVHCDDKFSLDGYLTLTNAPSGGGASMNTSVGIRYVYPTNVPGVGFALPASMPTPDSRGKYAHFEFPTPGDYGLTPAIAFQLVKTGPIASGAVVNASSFPQFSWDIATNGVNVGYSGLPIHLASYRFTGSLQFVTQTCTAQNKTVDMGKYNATYFKGKGSVAGPWMDASIQLTGCPTFSGYHGVGNQVNSYGSDPIIEGSRTANLFTLSVTPAHGLADSANNIMALESGTDAATGLGVQLKYGKVINNGIGEMTDMWQSGTSWDVPAPTDGSGSFKLPLAVIYYQTADRVTPGKANTQFTVNIDYK